MDTIDTRKRATDWVGEIYRTEASALAGKLEADALRGPRLRLALHKIGLGKRAAAAKAIDISERTLKRWYQGKGMDERTAIKTAKVLNDSNLVKWVFLGLKDSDAVDTTEDTPDTTPDTITDTITDTMTLTPLSDRHKALIRAYRWLPIREQIAMADRVFSVPSLSDSTPASGLDHSLDNEPLDDVEKALIAKLININSIAREIALINQLISECAPFQH